TINGAGISSSSQSPDMRKVIAVASALILPILFFALVVPTHAITGDSMVRLATGFAIFGVLGGAIGWIIGGWFDKGRREADRKPRDIARSRPGVTTIRT